MDHARRGPGPKLRRAAAFCRLARTRPGTAADMLAANCLNVRITSRADRGASNASSPRRSGRREAPTCERFRRSRGAHVVKKGSRRTTRPARRPMQIRLSPGVRRSGCPAAGSRVAPATSDSIEPRQAARREPAEFGVKSSLEREARSQARGFKSEHTFGYRGPQGDSNVATPASQRRKPLS